MNKRNAGMIKFWNLYKEKDLFASKYALKLLECGEDKFNRYILRCGVKVADVVPAPESGKMTNMYHRHDIIALKYAMENNIFLPIEELLGKLEVLREIKEYQELKKQRYSTEISSTQKKLVRSLEFDADVEFLNKLSQDEKKYIYVDKKRQNFVLEIGSFVKTSRVRVHEIIPIKYKWLSIMNAQG